MSDIKFKLPEVEGEYRFDFNLAPTTWFKVGGKAEVYYKPKDEKDLSYFLQNIDKNIPINIVGNCSNIIIRDRGIDGVVIKLARGFADIDLQDNEIHVGAGALNSSVAHFAALNGRSGIEFLIGIPGTIGGGIRMNAGAYGTEFKDVLDRFYAMDRSGEIHEYKTKDIDFTYRKCPLPEDLIFLKAVFNTSENKPELIKERMKEINQKRSESQPIKEKTSGSTFANPEGESAWKLIDSVGLRGHKIGDAIFSEKHCNFMINLGNAKASDLEELGELAIKRVFEEKGIKLRWEIKRIGKK